MLGGMDGRDGMRAADADLRAVADRLRIAVDEGRLDLHDYDERLQRAYAARTYAELDSLVADLPTPATPGASTLAVPDGTDPLPALPTDLRPVARRWLAEVWQPYLRVIPIVVAVWAVTSMLAGEVLYFWPAWVAGPWGAVLLVRTVTGVAGGEPRRWAAEQERRAARRARRRRARAAERRRRVARRAGEPEGAEQD